MPNALKSGKPGNDAANIQNSHEGAYDDKAARLEYVREMLDELVKIAHSANAPTLVYLLRMSALEAEDCLRVHQWKTEILS